MIFLLSGPRILRETLVITAEQRIGSGSFRLCSKRMNAPPNEYNSETTFLCWLMENFLWLSIICACTTIIFIGRRKISGNKNSSWNQEENQENDNRGKIIREESAMKNIDESEPIMSIFLAKLARKDGRTSIEKLNEELKMLKFKDPNLRSKAKAIQILKHRLQTDGCIKIY